jgi:hypothetical protein
MRSHDGHRRGRQAYFNAEGQAAMVISESILMGLIEHGVLTKRNSSTLSIPQSWQKRQMVQEGQDVEVSRIAAGLFTALQTSLAFYQGLRTAAWDPL